MPIYNKLSRVGPKAGPTNCPILVRNKGKVPTFALTLRSEESHTSSIYSENV